MKLLLNSYNYMWAVTINCNISIIPSTGIGIAILMLPNTPSTGIGITIMMLPSTYLSLILLLDLLHPHHKESLSM